MAAPSIPPNHFGENPHMKLMVLHGSYKSADGVSKVGEIIDVEEAEAKALMSTGSFCTIESFEALKAATKAKEKLETETKAKAGKGALISEKHVAAVAAADEVAKKSSTVHTFTKKGNP
jgi:hypothetical protein